MTRKPLWQMDANEFERYLKRNKLTGMAAANVGMTRRAQMKLHDDEIRERNEARLIRDYERDEQETR